MSKKSEIRFKFVFPPDYNPYTANGVWGGPLPNGEINLNFFQERLPVPNSIYQEVMPDGSLGTNVRFDPVEQVIIRYVVGGVTLGIENAKIIHKWLGEQISAVEKMRPVTVQGDTDGVQ